MGSARPPLANGSIDRDAVTRTDPALLRAAWNEPAARVLRIRGSEIAVRDQADGSLVLALDAANGDAPQAGTDGAPGHIFLGRMAGAPVFAEAVPAPHGEESTGATFDGGPEPETGGAERWSHPFQIAQFLSADENELMAIASALLRWHDASAFSPRDGSPTTVQQGGWARQDQHGGELFPRTDPAVIVLIEHEDRVLLGSNALWEAGRFSLLAGFVEAAESLEQTVVREVYEEAGVPVGDVEYVASQPWPFPRSLMLGFRARLVPGADPEDLNPDPAEISELRWFTRDELVHPAPGVILPRGLSIARWLLDAWIAEGDAVADPAADTAAGPGGAA